MEDKEMQKERKKTDTCVSDAVFQSHIIEIVERLFQDPNSDILVLTSRRHDSTTMGEFHAPDGSLKKRCILIKQARKREAHRERPEPGSDIFFYRMFSTQILTQLDLIEMIWSFMMMGCPYLKSNHDSLSHSSHNEGKNLTRMILLLSLLSSSSLWLLSSLFHF